jgi:hypothetical protein
MILHAKESAVSVISRSGVAQTSLCADRADSDSTPHFPSDGPDWTTGPSNVPGTRSPGKARSLSDEPESDLVPTCEDLGTVKRIGICDFFIAHSRKNSEFITLRKVMSWWPFPEFSQNQSVRSARQKATVWGPKCLSSHLLIHFRR